METWVVGCLVFVFLALVEYGIVLKMIGSSQEKAEEIETEIKMKRRKRALLKALQVVQTKRTGITPEVNSTTSQTYTVPGKNF